VGTKVLYGQLPFEGDPGEFVRGALPSVLGGLGPRQREIARIVYASTAARPRDVQARLSDPCSLRVVRTMLDRMVAKGLLRRRRSGRHHEIIYIAAIVTPSVKEVAVRRIVDEQFEGSFDDAAATIAELVKRTTMIPRSYAAVRRLVNERARGTLGPAAAAAIHSCA
jgi:predicted transcriptional regulator